MILKLMSVANTLSISELAYTEYKTALNSDYFVFKRFLNKKGKPFMAKFINSGFNNYMQVCLDTNANETEGAKLTGDIADGNDKFYYIYKCIGSAALFVVKKRYK